MHMLFYLFSIFGFLLHSFKKLPFFLYIPFYFVNLNLALFIGFIKSVFYKNNGLWESTER